VSKRKAPGARTHWTSAFIKGDTRIQCLEASPQLTVSYVSHFPLQLFYSFFKTLVGQAVTVELKNDMAITGVLVSVDQFLNIKLENIKVVDEERFPHMVRRREREEKKEERAYYKKEKKKAKE